MTVGMIGKELKKRNMDTISRDFIFQTIKITLFSFMIIIKNSKIMRSNTRLAQTNSWI